jgi:GAF domain-containing protein
MATLFSLPASVQHILTSGEPAGDILQNVLPMVGQILQADRCFLYLRNPQAQVGKIVFCWCRNAAIPDVTEKEFRNDTRELPKEDPLFAAALQTKPSIFVDDVETADPAILNKEFEAKTFGHRALIHAHITHNGQLWGILQPAIFGASRHWSSADKQFIEAIVPELVPLAISYMQESDA